MHNQSFLLSQTLSSALGSFCPHDHSVLRRSQQMPASNPNEDAPARRADGSLKEAWEMPDQFVFSPSDSTSIAPPRPISPSPQRQPNPPPLLTASGRVARNVNRDKFHAAVEADRAPTITPAPEPVPARKRGRKVVSESEDHSGSERDEDPPASSTATTKKSKKPAAEKKKSKRAKLASTKASAAAVKYLRPFNIFKQASANVPPKADEPNSNGTCKLPISYI